MVAVLHIKNESQYLWILPMIISLMLFQAQFTTCLDTSILRRVIRSFSRPENQTVAPVQFQEPLFSPTVPFLGELSDNLSVGRVIKIHGYVPVDAKRFDINLCTDCYEGPMQFHTSIRFHPKDIVTNTYNGKTGWGAEDRAGSSGVFPLALGSEFDMLIEVNQDNYNISINGRQYVSWTYAHRMSLTDVDKVEIQGNVLIWKIEYADKWHQAENEVISTSTSSDANEKYRYKLNGNVDGPLNINPSDMMYKFSLDLRCECVPQNLPTLP